MAQENGDKAAEAKNLGNLGLCSAAQAIGNQHSEAELSCNMGNIQLDQNDLKKALLHYENALAAFRAVGDRRSEGQVMGNIGIVYTNIGDMEKASHYFSQGLFIAKELRNRQSECNILGNLGNLYVEKGEMGKVMEYYNQSLTIARDIGDRYQEGNMLWKLGLTLFTIQDIQGAITNAEAALIVIEQVDQARAKALHEQIAQWHNQIAQRL